MTFEIVKGASQKEKDLLVSDSGYSYVHNKTYTKTDGECTMYWKCSVSKCKARVVQNGNNFKHSGVHMHPKKINEKQQREIRKEVNYSALLLCSFSDG